MADAACAEHGCVADGVDDLRDQDHRADLTGVAPGLGALGDDEVDTGVDMSFGVLRLAGERSRLHSELVATVDHVLWGRAESVDDQ